jgi:7,8-dihydro-6-hydroxymethylpterin-pyrophosphokinase
MKQFNIPTFYKSPIISKVKEMRKVDDPRKKDFTPTLLDFGPVQFYIARHFGFCYGVENAIEISYKALEENKGKRIFLLSQMIHNPDVNNNLTSHGIQFLQDTLGNELISFDTLTPEDVVIIPAFGTTLEIENKLGRTREVHKGPRLIDIDLLFYALEHHETSTLLLPHPRLWERSFVVLPLKELPFFKTLEKNFNFSNQFEVSAQPLSAQNQMSHFS